MKQLNRTNTLAEEKSNENEEPVVEMCTTLKI